MAEAGWQERRGTDLARGTQNPIAMKMTTPLENNEINRMTKGQQNIPKPYSRWPGGRENEMTRRPRLPRATKTAQTTARQNRTATRRRPSSRARQNKIRKGHLKSGTRNIPTSKNPNQMHREDKSKTFVCSEGHARKAHDSCNVIMRFAL